MTPIDRLIVALDLPPPEAEFVFFRLNRELGLTWFKIGVATLINYSGRILIENMRRDGAKIMLDLKVYDIGSTVERVVREASAMGAELLTVHVDSVKAAVESSNKLARPAILAVGGLTTNAADRRLDGYAGYRSDGIICHPRLVQRYRDAWGNGKLLVCPGVRLQVQQS